MKTRKHKPTKKRGITQKGGFNRTLYISIKDVTDQNQLACLLRNDTTIVYYIIDIFYKLLENLRRIEPNEKLFNQIIQSNITQTIDDAGIITNIGFSESEVTKILNTFSQGKIKFKMLSLLSVKIHATTACLTRLNNPKFQSLYIRNDDVLLNEFINKVKIIFNLPDTFQIKEFTDLYTKSTSNNEASKTAFDMLITKILHTTNNKLGAIQLNYGREVFTRVNRDKEYKKEPEPLGECFDDISTDEINQIYGVKNFLNTENTFVESIFNLYDRKLIGGLSGSAFYLYFLIIKILGEKPSKTVLYKIICIAILDYVPMWHSLEEILMTFSVDIKEAGYPEYKLDVDPLVYFKDILRPPSL